MPLKGGGGCMPRGEEAPSVPLQGPVTLGDGREREGDGDGEAVGVDEGSITGRRRLFREAPLMKNRYRP